MKQDAYGKVIIKHGSDLQRIYYRENTQKLILFGGKINTCTEYNYDKKEPFYLDIGEYMYNYELDKKTYIGPSAIYQRFATQKMVFIYASVWPI